MHSSWSNFYCTSTWKYHESWMPEGRYEMNLDERRWNHVLQVCPHHKALYHPEARYSSRTAVRLPRRAAVEPCTWGTRDTPANSQSGLLHGSLAWSDFRWDRHWLSRPRAAAHTNTHATPIQTRMTHTSLNLLTSFQTKHTQTQLHKRVYLWTYDRAQKPYISEPECVLCDRLPLKL